MLEMAIPAIGRSMGEKQEKPISAQQQPEGFAANCMARIAVFKSTTSSSSSCAQEKAAPAMIVGAGGR